MYPRMHGKAVIPVMEGRYKPSRTLFLLLILLVFLNHIPESDSAEPATPVVWLTDLNSAIGPAVADYLQRTLQEADERNIELLILRINTPGGLDAAMRDIVSHILSSPVPVAAWVAPSGARAASAGTYITMASHIAAMAEATNIGSSTPVNLSGPEDERSDMDNKVINDAVAYLQGLAELRGRNIDWARQTVTEAANLPAREAVEQHVVDLLANDLEELLGAVNGRSIATEAGERTLMLDDAVIQLQEPGWRHRFLNVITNPNIAYLLLMAGVYGLILEFYNPGTAIPGIAGLICLLLGAYALQMLPISYAGLALLVLGMGLMVTEAFTPSFGIFGLSGLAAFVLGSIMLIDTDTPAWQISLGLIAAISVATAGLIVLALGAALKARQRPVVSGNSQLQQQPAIAMEDFGGPSPRGHVQVNGEIWTAICQSPVKKGDSLHILQINGLTLDVEPASHHTDT